MKPKVIHKETQIQVYFACTIFALCLTSLHYILYDALAQETTENFLTYTNIDYGFTIKYPSDWVVNDKNETGPGVHFYSPDGLAGTFVSSLYLPANETGMSLENISKDILIGFHLRLLEINTGTYFLSGYPAIRAIAIGPLGGPHDIKMMILIANIGGRIYDVGYMSIPERYPNYLPVAQEMIDSFQAISSPLQSK